MLAERSADCFPRITAFGLLVISSAAISKRGLLKPVFELPPLVSHCFLMSGRIFLGFFFSNRTCIQLGLDFRVISVLVRGISRVFFSTVSLAKFALLHLWSD